MPLRFNPDAFDKSIPQHIRERVQNRIYWLWENRVVVRHLPLTGELAGFNKLVFSEYRIIYTFAHDKDELVVHRVAPRKTVYRTMEKKQR